MNRQLVVAPLTFATVLVGIPTSAAVVVGQVAPQQTVACAFPMIVTDTTGTEVTITDGPGRVVTTNPSVAWTMWKLGVCDEVVGILQYAMHFDDAANKGNVSGSSGFSVEAVIGLEPNLVLVSNSSYNAEPDRIAQLRSIDIPVVVSEFGESFVAAVDKTERVGCMTDNYEAGAERAVEMCDSIANMEQALNGAERPVGLDSFSDYSSGSGTFISDVMATAGLWNGATETNLTGFAQINEELIVEMNPEYIIVFDHAPVPSSLAYNNTMAMQEGSVIIIEAYKLQQSAPRVIGASEVTLEAVHPDAYERYQQLETEPVATSIESATEMTTVAGATATDATETGPTEATMTESPDSATESDASGFGIATSLAAIGAAFLLTRRR